MISKLIIVESPSKCKKIESYAGKEYKCLATYGHIYSLTTINDIDFTNNYMPTYRLVTRQKKHLDAIRDIIQQIDKENIYLATDPDREGEAIAWHLCQHFKLNINTTKRILFNEITEDAIKYSLANPQTINMKMVESQKARQTIDIIVGFKTCPVLWKYMGIGDKKSPLSAGRCQTPCLKLVNDLYEKESNKNLREIYKLNILFNSVDLLFSTDFPPSLVTSATSHDYIKSLLLFLGNHCSYSLTRSDVKKSILKAPSPLSTSLLQQKANQYLGMSPHTTMKTAQKLYERGLITYMRTDSHRYSKNFISQTIHYIKNTVNSCIKPNYKDYLMTDPHSLETNKSKGHSQDGHESIRPTNIAMNIDEIKSLSPPEQKLYYFIFYHVLQTFMKDCIVSYYDLILKPTTAPKTTHIKDDERTLVNTLLLKTTLKTDDYIGWKVVDTKYKHVINGDADNDDAEVSPNNKKQLYNTYLRELNKDTCIIFENDKLKTIYLEPSISGEHKYLSEASLVKELENKQIGRPSTFASLVEKIQSRHYVFKMNIQPQEMKSRVYSFYNIGNKDTIEISNCLLYTSKQPNRLVIQELGKNVNSFCYAFFEPLFNYDFTASLERDLDLIVAGELTYSDVCKKCDDSVKMCISSITKNTTDNKETTLAIKNNYKSTATRCLGTYNNNELIIKCGVYGYYLQNGNDKYSLRHMNMIDIEDFIRNDVIEFIEKQKTHKDANLLREIDDKISIWKGKKNKSDYIMIKATHSKNSKYTKKPQFISLKAFDGDYLECDDERIREFIKNV
jgi:DNA topoisomerase-1